MSANIQSRANGTHQLRIIHKLLKKPFFYSHPDLEHVKSVKSNLVGQLAMGIVPRELMGLTEGATDLTEKDISAGQMIRNYIRDGNPSPSDKKSIHLLLSDVGDLKWSGLTVAWCNAYVRRLKVVEHMSPATVQSRVGQLRRVIDWHLQSLVCAGVPESELRANPVTLLPRHYAKVSEAEADLLRAANKEVKENAPREYRIPREAEVVIRQLIRGETKDPDRRRGLKADPELDLFFDLIINTGLRLYEAYRLTVDRIDFTHGLLRVRGSKGWRGAEKPRVTPLVPHLTKRLKEHCEGRTGLVFSYWDGQQSSRNRTSARLSRRIKSAFIQAGHPYLNEHDMRHEATCRWVEMRNDKGWVFSDAEICKIMGWKDPRMMLRYASLRGQDLSSRLYTAETVLV